MLVEGREGEAAGKDGEEQVHVVVAVGSPLQVPGGGRQVSQHTPLMLQGCNMLRV